MKKVRMEEMLPRELEQIVAEEPVAWIPVGTLEWHGRHLPVGLDAVKAHELCLRAAARSGGVVLPANYFSMLGMVFPWTFRYSPALFFQTIWSTLDKLYKQGFRVMFPLTGHYPLAQIAVIVAAAEAFMTVRNAVVVAGPEFFACENINYHGDHAAKWETSIMMELRPELVDREELNQFSGMSWLELFRNGIQGHNPADQATPETGAEVVEEIVARLSDLANELMNTKDKKTARRYHRDAAIHFLRNVSIP